MKIAILHYACLPIVGGVESIMATHAQLLEKAGHEAYIIAGRGDPQSAGLRGAIIPEIDSKHPQREGASKWIAWCHDLAWNNPLYTDDLLPRWPWTPLKYPLPNVIYVAISERRREEMATLFRVPLSDIVLVPNGVDPSAYIPDSL